MSTQCRPDPGQFGSVMSPAWDHRKTPTELSQPFTTRQMNSDPCTTMAMQRDPGSDGYNTDCTYTASKTGPKELASYGARITAWNTQPCVSHGVVQQQQDQQPDVMAPHNSRPKAQKGPSRRPVPERNGSAQKHSRQNRHLASGEGHGPDSQGVGRNSALETALSVPTRHGQLDHSFGQSVFSSIVPTVITSSASQGGHVAHSQDPTTFIKDPHKLPSHTHCPAPHPATLKRQAMSNKKPFTDALIHDFIAERLDNMNQRNRCKGAERTRCLSSSSNLNAGPPSKQNTGLLHLKPHSAAPQQFTSTASSEAVGLSSAGNAGSSTLYCIGNKQLSTACGKGIPEEHAELTGNVEKQDGHAKSTPESDSTGTQDTALNNSHIVYINECTVESPNVDLTKLLGENVLCETGGKHVLNNIGDDETGDIGDGDYYKTKRCQGTIANELSTMPILCYSFVALKELVAILNSISYNINACADAEDSVFDVIVRCYWNGNKDDVHVFTSTEYPQIMMLAAAVCAKNEDENPVILSAISEITLKELMERDPDLKVGNNVTQEYTSSWLNVNKSLDDLDKEPGARHRMSCVCHPEALHMGTRSVADDLQAKQMNAKTAEEHTKMDTAVSIKMSVLSVQEAPCFKSQEYEDISDYESQNGKAMSIDALPSETSESGRLSDTSSSDCQIYEDISDDEISRDESLIVDEPLVTLQLNNVKQPTESPTNDSALAEKSIISTKQSSNGTAKGGETLRSAEEEFCPSGGMNYQYNKGPGFDISCSSPEKYAVIYISSDEDPTDFSTDGDGHTDPEMQVNGTAVISSGLKVRDVSNFPQKHKATPKVPLKVRSCNSPHIEVLEVESTEVSQRVDAEEDWVMIPVSIHHLRFDEVDGSHVPLAKTKSISKNIPPQPSTTKTPLVASSSSKLVEFDTLQCFIQSQLSYDSPIIVVSEDELPVPKPMEGNRIPTEPINGSIIPRCRKESSSCDTEDSCDYSLSQSRHNYLTASPQCWENRNRRKSLKRKKKNLKQSAKSPCTNALSDSTDDSCVDDVQESLMTHLTMTPEAKSSPIESDKDNLNVKSVEFKKAPTKYQAKINRTTTLERLKILTVLQKSHLAEDHQCQVKGPRQTISPDSDIDQEHPCVAGAEDPNRELPEPNSIIPRYAFRMPSEQSEPLKLELELTIHSNKKDDPRLSKEIQKTSQVNLANRHSRNKTRNEELQSNIRKMTPKQLESRAALQKNTGHSTASSEPPRTASSSEHATPSPMETSPSSMYSRCLPTAPRRRISHYASGSAQRTASSREDISHSTNKTNDSKHQKPFSQQDRSTSAASRSKKVRFKIPSKHPSTASQNASVLEPHKQKHNSMPSTPLMTKTKAQAQRWMQAITPQNVGLEERRPSVGDGYKWKNANDSGKPGPPSPEYEHLSRSLAANKRFF